MLVAVTFILFRNPLSPGSSPTLSRWRPRQKPFTSSALAILPAWQAGDTLAAQAQDKNKNQNQPQLDGA